MKWLILSIVLIIVLVGVFVLVGNSPDSAQGKLTVVNSSSENQEILNNSDQPKKITQAELASHNTASDCWVGFQGEVYDITTYIPNHPGGKSKITNNCGTSTEFEKEFLAKHGNSKISQLKSASKLIGELA